MTSVDRTTNKFTNNIFPLSTMEAKTNYNTVQYARKKSTKTHWMGRNFGTKCVCVGGYARFRWTPFPSEHKWEKLPYVNEIKQIYGNFECERIFAYNTIKIHKIQQKNVRYFAYCRLMEQKAMKSKRMANKTNNSREKKKKNFWVEMMKK